MKGILVILILAAFAAAWYRLPASHHHAATGTYFIRDYISFTTPSGVIVWAPGQKLREDLNAPLVEGGKTLTDGKFATVIPEAVLTQDIEDAEAFRLADTTGQSQTRSDLDALKTRLAKDASPAQVASAQAVVPANAVSAAATTGGSPDTAPNGSTPSVGYNGYVWNYDNYQTVYVERPFYPAKTNVTIYGRPRMAPLPKSTPKPLGIIR